MSAPKPDKQQISQQDQSFISRWSRRKQDARNNVVTTEETIPAVEVVIEKPLLTDTDMPPIERLTEDSDYSGFLSPKVSEALRRQALRKLFHSAAFNIRDGLDDYDDVYTEFEKLGDIVTADMRHQLEMEAQRRARQMAEAGSVENQEEQQVAAVTTQDNGALETEELPEDSEMNQVSNNAGDAEVKS